MEAAVDIDNLTRGIRKRTRNKRRNRFCNILGNTHTGNRKQAVRNQLFIFCGNCRRHIRADNARTNFINVDTVFRKTNGKKLGCHGKSRFGNAVFASVYACRIRRHRGYVHDGFSAFCFDHTVCRILCQKERAFQIDIQESIHTFFRHFQNILTDERSNPCVIDQHIHFSEFLKSRIHKIFSCLLRGNIRRNVNGFGRDRFQLGNIIRRFFFICARRRNHDKAVCRKLQGDRFADSAGSTRYNRCFFHIVTSKILSFLFHRCDPERKHIHRFRHASNRSHG